VKIQTKRLAIAAVLTIVDVAAGKYYRGVIWEAFALDLFAKAAVLGLLCLGFATAAVIWLHVADGLRQALRERDDRLTLNAAMAPADQVDQPILIRLPFTPPIAATGK